MMKSAWFAPVSSFALALLLSALSAAPLAYTARRAQDATGAAVCKCDLTNLRGYALAVGLSVDWATPNNSKGHIGVENVVDFEGGALTNGNPDTTVNRVNLSAGVSVVFVVADVQTGEVKPVVQTFPLDPLRDKSKFHFVHVGIQKKPDLACDFLGTAKDLAKFTLRTARELQKAPKGGQNVVEVDEDSFKQISVQLNDTASTTRSGVQNPCDTDRIDLSLTIQADASGDGETSGVQPN